ncbi:MAG: peptidase [Sphingobacteriales bacterium 17-39-43]|uniref:M14 family metallopeptidase n=1 Tax=Daejeonella sp. TaxID=2805397 RepID=UPI000BC6940C|nr:M14 metallopeptidase family protein [Daejeonella sp.]OYZ32557.1 MAG: peptidase [Sphingobacteriales bacterium 16-39-50]OZA25920.1 MAG: peptidase [Sphingobacteriales bacterium 17-39-43]HQT21879.1 M14 family metallopeptidase [Daejeonella sp.]HQT57186.1 M14 family metallopeptidase [Daejeonella sp.]
MRKFSLLFACIFLLNNLFAQISPKEHFGFTIGDDYQLANFSQTADYFKKLSEQSDRVKLLGIGMTEEGRTQPMLIVSSPENLKNLEQYKEISQKLARAEDLSESEARALAEKGKAIVWIDGGLHATETLGIHQLIETLWNLVSRKDAETIRILDNTIILMTHANPDGHELVSDWYMREEKPENRSLQNLPRLYEKYAGHDNNRDFFMMNLKETQNMSRQLFVDWLPQIMYNHHQRGPEGSVVAGAPYRDPFNYVFDPILMTSLDALGAAMNSRLNVENKPGYTQKYGSVFSTWYNGGLRTTTYFHNIIGLLTETIGGPTPSEISLVPQRLIPNGGTTFPVTPQKWHFRQSIDYSVSLNYAVLNYAVRYRDELLFNIYRMGKNSIERGSKDTWGLSPNKVEAINQAYLKDQPGAKIANQQILPKKYFDTVMNNPANRDARGYIIPSDQADFQTAVKFVNALIRSGILVHKATSDFNVAGKNYPKGSFIIKTNQAFRPHVLDMFEPQDHPNDFKYEGGPPVAPYDAAGWTLAYMMHVQFDRLQDDFNGPFERIPYGELQKHQSGILASAKSYLINAESNNAFIAVNEVLKAGEKAYRIKTGDERGDFYIPGNPKTRNLLHKVKSDAGLEIRESSKVPENLTRLSELRIGLWDTYGGSMSSGWVRLLMEQFNFKVSLVYAKDIEAGNLNEKYDVLIFVPGAIPAISGRTGRGNSLNTGPDPETILSEFRGQLGRINEDKSIPELKKFIELGSKVVSIGSSTNLAYHLNLPVRNAIVELGANGIERSLPAEKYYIPGSILSADTDNKIPAAWGMPAKSDIYFDRSPVFKISTEAIASGKVKPILWFSNPASLRSGWAWGQAYLRDGVTAFEAEVGKGKLYAFGPEITFRAQTHGTFKLLFNQLYGHSE